jgi:hypothetical protein
MPSNKEPVKIVNPGPGHIPDGTVSASSLTFPIPVPVPSSGDGGGDAVDITSTGVNNYPRFSISTNVQAILEDIYEDFDSQAFWVLDSAAVFATHECDYDGSGALISAMSNIVTNGERKALLLKPGTYTWDDSAVFNGMPIIGVGPGTVTIQATSGMRIGAGVSFSNVTLAVTGNLQFTGDSNRLENVTLNVSGGNIQVSGASNRFENGPVSVTGNLVISGDYNLLENVSLTVGGTAQIQGSYTQILQTRRSGIVSFTVTGTHNLLSQVRASQLADSSVTGNNSYRDILLDGTPKTASASILAVSGSNSVFHSVIVTPAGAVSSDLVLLSGSNLDVIGLTVGAAATTGKALHVSGQYNRLTTVKISSITGSTAATVSVDGDNNLLDNIHLSGLASTTVHLDISGSNVSANQIFIASSNVTQNSIALTGFKASLNRVLLKTVTSSSDTILVQSYASSIRDLKCESCTATVGNILEFNSSGFDFNLDSAWFLNCSSPDSTGRVLHGAGKEYLFRNVRVDGCSPGNSFAAVDMQGTNGLIDGLVITGLVQASTSASGLGVSGIGCKARCIEFSGISACAYPLLRFGGSKPTVSNVLITGVATTTGFQVFQMNADSPVLDGLLVTNCPTFGTDKTVMQVTSCRNAVIQNVRFITVGATTAPDGPYFDCAASSTSTNTTFRNALFSNISVGSSSTLINLIPTLFDGALFEEIVASAITWTSVDSNIVKIIAPTLSWFGSQSPIRFQNCKFNQTAGYTTGCALQAINVGKKLVFESCVFTVDSSSGAGYRAVYLQGSPEVAFKNCSIIGAEACSSRNNGTLFENCIFGSVAGAIGKRQLFSGYGNVNGPKGQLVLKNCTMLITGSNIDTTGTGIAPIVFLGGAGVNSAVTHSGTVVDGLSMMVDPSISIAFWHNAPTLCVDVMTGSSSFNNLKIDLQGIPFANSASATYVFPDPFPVGCVVEILGPDGTATPATTSFKNLSLLRLPRAGGDGSGRGALKAQGVSIDGLCLDSVTTGVTVSWNGPGVILQNALLTNVDMYPTNSLPVGTASGFSTHIVATRCVVSNVTMRNFAVEGAQQTALVYLDNSILSNSRLTMPAGSHVPLASSGGKVVWCVGNSTVKDNVISINHNAANAADSRIGIKIEGDHTKVMNNILVNAAEANSSGYFTNPMFSNGGGIQIWSSGSDCWICNNSIQFEWENSSDNFSSILSSGGRCVITGNNSNNTAFNSHSSSGGTNFLSVTGGSYSTVSNNMLQAYNSNTGHIAITTSSAGSSTVMGNHVDNRSGQVGEITLDGTDRPSPANSFNTLT